MALEQSVARHYTHGSLQAAIFGALEASGKDTDRLEPGDLPAVDEFHIGGRQATVDFATQLGVRPSLHLLDIGCGLGGASRYFAHEHGCRMTGVDLTEEYVLTAKTLSERVGLGHQVSYQARTNERPRSVA
jgi:2-polyprenyl-3-methyl-5-hydroxy-6-metoxy-1,4-benzoquinol methylase